MILPQIVFRQRASAGSWYVTFLILTSVVRRDAEVDQVLHLRDSFLLMHCDGELFDHRATERPGDAGTEMLGRSKFPLRHGTRFLRGRYARWKCRSLGPV